LPQHFDAIDLRQLQIEQHQAWRLVKRTVSELSAAEDIVQSLLAIAHHENVIRQAFTP
jgi:hypothetical protein